MQERIFFRPKVSFGKYFIFIFCLNPFGNFVGILKVQLFLFYFFMGVIICFTLGNLYWGSRKKLRVTLGRFNLKTFGLAYRW
jgi:hypothetical protein